VVSYALVASAHTPRSGEAAMKYFVQGAVATALFLFGIAVFVGVFAPSGRYATLLEVLVTPKPFFTTLAAAGLVISFLAFKMGAFPFHSWAPDAYETAPVEAAAFLAAGPKLAAIAAAGVFVSIVSSGQMGPRVLVVTAVLAMLSIIVGSVAALAQRDYRRLLGYAGVAQAGYALIAVALSTPPLAVFFGATYALATAGTFLAAHEFSRIRPDWDGSVAGLAGMGRRAPLLAGSVAVLLIPRAGVPPFLGFWGKLLVFGTGLSYASQTAAASPAIAGVIVVAVAIGILGSIVSLGYYGSILRSIYFDHSENNLDDAADEAPRGVGTAGATVVALAIAVMALGLIPLVAGSTVIFELFVAR
jgi:NADH-quinone oxidoreductase subunit N